MTRQRDLVRALALVCILTSPLQGQGRAEPRRLYPRGPYAQLTDNYRDQTNFNVETVRGLAIAEDGDFYAINTHGSELIRHSDAKPEPEGAWPTVHNPVSLGIHGDLAVVAGGSTHALVIHDRFDGEVLALRMLPSEPGDLVIDETTNIVYVASQAENIVVALDISDLTDIRELRRYVIPGEQPRFLSLDVHPNGERAIVVAPMLSGNNSIPFGGREGTDLTLEGATGNIFNLSGLQDGGLPDEDLFVLPLVGDPLPAELRSGREAGTLMMAHGRNPLTGEYWALNVDLHNDIPGQRSEFELRGTFATNALTIYSPEGLDGVKGMPDRIVDLDDADHFISGEQYSSQTSLSFPYALEFVPATSPNTPGWAFIASSTGDRIGIFAPSGNRQGSITLPEGSIPRDLVVNSQGEWLGVYCWGTNELLVYSLEDLETEPVQLELGLDPTPPAVKKGREIFYDADPSQDGRTTCASCHAAGGNDNLTWKLSGLGDDQKDIMVTQSLIGIQDTPLYHWREERTLEEFNAAFPGLLGTAEALDESPGGELDNLVDFILSLQPHANHEQNPRRLLDDERTPRKYRNGYFGSAVRGQDVFLNVPSGSVFPCGGCHIFPSGTLGVAVPDTDPDVCRAQTVGVAHLRQLNHRDQDVLEISDPALGLNPLPFPRGGHGFLHSGIVPDLLSFAELFPRLTPQQQADIASFLHQYDQGIAPASHFAIRMDSKNSSEVEARVRDLLLRQAERGWIDVVAFGRTSIDGTWELRWVYQPHDKHFQSDRLDIPRLTLGQISQLAESGLSTNVFMGLPPGTGEMWALDPDGDGLSRILEVSLGTDATKLDTDGDGYPDGYEVMHESDPLAHSSSVDDTDAPVMRSNFPRLDHLSATFAKFFVEYDEPVRLEIQSSVEGGPIHETRARVFARRHTVVVQGLDPSPLEGAANAYTSTIRAYDYSGNASVETIDYETLTSCSGDQLLHVNDLHWLSATPTGNGDFSATAEILVEMEQGAPFPPPAADRVVAAKVFYRTDPSLPWEEAVGVSSPHLRRSFALRRTGPDGSVTISEYTSLPGPYLLSPPTDESGRARLSFFFPGVVMPNAEVEIRLSIQAILEPSPEHTPANPVFEYSSLELWSMPATAEEFRQIDFKL